MLLSSASSSVDALAQPHEQHHAHVVAPSPGRWRSPRAPRGICSTWRIDLGRADAHAAGVERGVGAAVDDHAAVRRPLGEVAMAPDVGEALEIGGAVFRAVGIVPEPHRHRRERLGADQLARLPAHRAGRPRSTPRPPCRGPAPGSRRARPAQVGSPQTKHDTMSVPPEIEARCTSGLDVLIDVVEALRRQRRAGRGDQPHGWRDRGCWRGSSPAFLQASMYLAEVPNSVDPLVWA